MPSDEEWCPECRDTTVHAIIEYRPNPNTAQRESADVPTDDLPLVAADLCTACGTVLTTLPNRNTAVAPIDSEERNP